MTPRPIIALLASLIACTSSVYAADLTWDITPGTVGAGDSAVTGGTGTWDTTNGNWTTDGGVNNVAWDNGNNDTAIFGGTAGTVTLGSDITVGGMAFSTNGYSIAPGAGPFTLTLGTNANFSVETGNSNHTATITASILGNSTLTKSGSGILLLDAISDSFTGDIQVSEGTLRIGNNNTTARLGGTTYAGNILINGLLHLTHNQNQTFSGVISGSGNLNKGGSGILTLSGANTYTGKTIIAGSGAGGPGLSISSFNSVVGGTASSSLGAPTTVANGTIQFGNSGNQRSSTLIYTGSGETTDRVMNVQFNSGAKHTINQSGTGLLKFTSNFTITPSSGTTAGGLVLRGVGDGEIAQMGTIPGVLEKRDAGTWTIGGTNGVNSMSVIEGALVNGGEFNVTTSVTVSAGATLTAGYITAASMSLNATSTLNMDLGGTTLGTDYDNITITGAGAMAYGGNLIIGDVGAYDMDASSQTYDLFDINGGSTGSFANVTVNGIGLSNSGGLWTGVNGDASYSFDQITGDLSVTVVPEPSVAILGSLGLLCLLRRHRR